jgi:peptidoglycan/LPS O-acetylase OafA/YrhL
MKRLPQLDILRGIAILLVLGAHPVVKLDESGWFWPLAYLWGYAGWTGVNLFFVLSGFLVGGLLLGELRATGRLSAGRFMVRRMFKIWPSYYAYLLFLLAIVVRVGLDSRVLVPYFLHVQNYFEVPIGIAGTGTPAHGLTWRPAVPAAGVEMIAPHTWSLAVEEHFYLLLPIILCCVRSTRVLTAILAACLAGCALARGMANVSLPTEPTHHNLDSLAFGVFLAHAFHFRPGVFRRFSCRPAVLIPAGTVLGAIGVVYGKTRSPMTAALVPISLYLGFGMILVAMMGLKVDQGASGLFFRSVAVRLLVKVGIFSYSIYLWHVDVAYRLVQMLARAGVFALAGPSVRWLVLMATYVLLAIGLGVLAARCIEFPALALRDRLFPPRDRSRAGTRPIEAALASQRNLTASQPE